MIKLSIIIPIYNVEKYLSKCLNSILEQTYKEIEIILVNDGSTDNSKDIAVSYCERFPNIFKYFEKDNGGLSSARNFGLEKISGDFVGFLDSDDYIDNDLYEIMINSLDSSIKIVECDFIWEYENGKSVLDKTSEYNSIKDLMVNGRVVAWNKIYNVEWLEKINIKFKEGLLYEDLNFFFKIVPHLTSISEISTVKNSFVHYVQHKGTITSDNSLNILDIIKSYEDVFHYYNEKQINDLYFDELEYKFSRNLMGAFLKRAIKIKDKRQRKIILDEFWNNVLSYYPNWKKNKYIKKLSKQNILLFFINKYTYKLFYLL